MVQGRDPVFISYARDDGASFATEIHARLNSSGINAWLDQACIPPGSDWDSEIDLALAEASAVIIVVTPGSNVSIQVKSEWNDALARHLPIIPVLPAPCSLPRVLAMVEAIDFCVDFEAGWNRLLDRLRDAPDDHIAYLQGVVRALENAQADADRPERFQTRIDSLRTAIERLGPAPLAQGVTASLESRLREGLEAQRALLAEDADRNKAELGRRVAGQRLPDISTHFRDRVVQKRDLCRLLAAKEVKLVTVVGRGGIGKSGLVSTVLTDLEDGRWTDSGEAAHVDAIIYLSSRTRGITLERLVHDCASVLSSRAAARVLSEWTNPDGDTLSRVHSLLDEMRGARIVLLLDNLEDLQDARGGIVDSEISEFVNTAIARRHALTILVTSRVPILLPRELAVHDHQVHVAEGLPNGDAIEMIRDLDPNGTVGLHDYPVAELEQLAELVHGIPRALEVAVGLLSSDPFLTVGELDTSFYRRPEVLDDLVAENFRRMDPDARIVIEVLAAFRGPVPPIAVEFVCAQIAPQVQVKDVLRRLVHHHAVSFERGAKTISLHPVDRDFARSRTEQRGSADVAKLHGVAADYYRGISLDPDSWTGIASIEPQIEEFEHRIAASDYERAAQIMQDIDHNFLGRWGYFERVLTMRESLARGPLPAAALALNFDGISYALYALGRYRESATAARQAIDLGQETDDLGVEASALANLGRSLRHSGDAEGAILAHRRGAEIAALQGDQIAEGVHLGNIARVLDVGGDLDAAMEYYRRALGVALKAGDRRGESYRRGYLGVALARTGSVLDGEASARRAVAICEEIGYLRGLGIHLSGVAAILLMKGMGNAAETEANRALTLGRSMGSGYVLTLALETLGRLAASRGEGALARQHLDEAMLAAAATADLGAMGRILSAAGETALLDRDWDDAAYYCERSLAEGTGESDARNRSVIGAAALSLHKTERAASAFREGVVSVDMGLRVCPRRLDLLTSAALLHLGLSITTDGPTFGHARRSQGYAELVFAAGAPGVSRTLTSFGSVIAAGAQGGTNNFPAWIRPHVVL